MRKVIYASLVIVVCLFTGYRYFTKPLTKSTIKVHENIRVIAYFNDSLVQGSTITTQVGSIRSESIRSLLEQFRVRELKAVFLNRYGENGFLKPVEINNSVYDTLKGWQEIMIEDNGRAAELVSLLGMEAGVLYAHIERPYHSSPALPPMIPCFYTSGI